MSASGAQLPGPEEESTELVPADGREYREIVTALFREYADTLDFDLCFQNFEAELAALPGEYAPPRGALLLARVDGADAGCVALRALDDVTCEMKRLYVRPAFRGRGVGRLLVVQIIAEAQRRGYRRMVLDTVATMDAAMTLYRSLGFREAPPYYHNPQPGARYFERAI